jgi:predicted Rossmann fold flavoprotein
MMEKFDVAVVGAGSAGMMAAARAGEGGAKVVLLEKSLKPGRKLLLTGNGRCNLCQAEFDIAALVQKYGKAGKFLFPAFNLFGPREVMDFFEGKGVALKVEEAGKVFPKSDRATDILGALLVYLRESRVEMRFDSAVKAVVAVAGKIKWIIAGDEKVTAEKYVIATGGKSYTQTGSEGEGFNWLKELGHTLTELRPGMVPVKVREKWVTHLQGLSLKDVELSLWQNNKKQDSACGDVVFTHFGLSGPAILDLSGAAGGLLRDGPVKLTIDLFPRSSLAELDARLLGVFKDAQNKMVKNCLADVVPARLAETLIGQAALDPGKKVNVVTRDDRQNLARLLKNLDMTVTGTLGFEQAMVTVGGVDLKEVDPSSMRSKIVGNLHVAGELLNLSGPSGGYNLQMCWSTGFLAGTAAVKW